MTTDTGFRIEETYVNKTRGYQFGEDSYPIEEHLIREDGTPDAGEIFRRSREEYGRCVSAVYVDTKSRGVVRTGWVFEKKMRYDDCADTYIREVWVTIQRVVEPAQVEVREAVSVGAL